MESSAMWLLMTLMVVSAAVTYTEPHQSATSYRAVDKAFLQKQQDVYKILRNIFHDNGMYKEHSKMADSYDVISNIKKYTNQSAIKEFWRMYKNGMLPKHRVFSIFYEPHKREAASLFWVFYYAEDWTTFLKTAVWARKHINEKMFMYSFICAILHRADTQGIMIPPIYEVNPYYFVDKYYINKVFNQKSEVSGLKAANTKKHVVTKKANFCDYNFCRPDDRLAYFTDDFALNQYYYYFHVDYPYWLGGDQVTLKKDKRDSLYYYVHQQLMARYHLERLSNGLGPVPDFDFGSHFPGPITAAAAAARIQHPNGMDFVNRHPYNYHHYFGGGAGGGDVADSYYGDLGYYGYHGSYNYSYRGAIQKVEAFERRLLDSLDTMHYKDGSGKSVKFAGGDDEGGFEIFCSMINSNFDLSLIPTYYGPIENTMRFLLSGSPLPKDKDYVQTGLLQIPETTLRDPAFYMYWSRLLNYYQAYKARMPSYCYEQLTYPGVEIKDVQVDKLVTYFEPFTVDISNVVGYTEENYDQIDGQATYFKLVRLAHKPFAYKVHVKSDVKADAMVRVFIGPKYDPQGHEMSINDCRMYFFEMDKFVYSLHEGDNYIVGNSSYAYGTTHDFTTQRQAFDQMLRAIGGQSQFMLESSEMHNGFPNRLILPKGSPHGQIFQMFFMVSPYKEPTAKVTHDYIFTAGVGSGARYLDDYPFGYPFDRPVDEYSFYTPNMHFHEVTVFHRDSDETKGTIGGASGAKKTAY